MAQREFSANKQTLSRRKTDPKSQETLLKILASGQNHCNAGEKGTDTTSIL